MVISWHRCGYGQHVYRHWHTYVTTEMRSYTVSVPTDLIALLYNQSAVFAVLYRMHIHDSVAHVPKSEQ